MKSNKILGFIFGAHSCGVAYSVDGDVVVIEEERLSRVKTHKDFENNFERFPQDSLNCLISRHGLVLDEVDTFTSFFPYDVASNVIKFLTGFDIPEHKYHRVDHHLAHASMSYHLSGFSGDTLVFCADASGGVNAHSSRTYLGSRGELSYIDGIKTSRVSLGHYYAALTELLGFKRLKDEGKIVGISGHGKFVWEDLYSSWKSAIGVNGTQTALDRHHIEAGGIYYSLFARFYEVVGSRYWKEREALQDIALTGQRVFEDCVVDLIRNYSRRAPSARKIALSGGIFANVKLNKRVMEMPEFDEVFVVPPMGDEGLAYGCVLETMRMQGTLGMPVTMTDTYLGNSYSEREVLEASHGTVRRPLDTDLVADLLCSRKILGLYQGRSEHGPRALGNRSIICDATHPETYSILNGRLKRNDYMPFAPAVLDQCADEIFHIPGSRHTMEFMTMLVDTRDEWKDRIPTVVHPVDKTARIQLVRADTNPLFHQIIWKYRTLTGVGLLVNTSFNVHEEPIVERPEEAFAHLRSGIVDALVTEHGIFTAS